MKSKCVRKCKHRLTLSFTRRKAPLIYSIFLLAMFYSLQTSFFVTCDDLLSILPQYYDCSPNCSEITVSSVALSVSLESNVFVAVKF